LLIDSRGREIARKMGPAEWDGQEMLSLVKQTMHAQTGSDGDRGR
jgi:hypothetical protein